MAARHNGEDMRGDTQSEGDALNGELELALLDAVPRRVAERGGLGNIISGGGAKSVSARSVVIGDGASVDVRLDLVDGGDKMALRARLEKRISPPRRVSAEAAGARCGEF